ncbi:N-acetyl-gamma-glutamyl-phosphate reductase [Clostridium felsineum]|uniref:N-acetyl-gamma-glutamyl-phosphate reductase n=1 Tax=Clostridium felsineum TaxID=36839 RepID=UPI00214D41B5|nr:N-acetyl-gamma-glutamyl-phosphate reductase [Clostridium felsineum]MCR3759805.1 N-acetyl-gamma-glutamyl-phosphate reductase [Clostridium felsineum]
MIRVGIIGATGYAGEVLTWLLNNHPNVNLVFLASHSYGNSPFSSTYGNFTNIIEDLCIDTVKVYDNLDNIDILFTALPSGKTFSIVKKALENGVKVIDLGADYRLKSYETYEEWYNITHQGKELLKNAVYGLSEIYREKIKTSNLIANPGCYPTASSLALIPLLKHKLIDTNSIIIDAKSGVSGAGRKASTNNLFIECNDSIKAYGDAHHRHTPEIEQTLSYEANENILLTFTPHLVPMNRGILCACYSNLNKKIKLEEIYSIYKEFYNNELFIRIIDKLPETRWVKNSNYCDIGIRIDQRTNKIIVFSAIDNLMKGAASQAVQNMNIMYGLPEQTGINLTPMFP